MHVGRVVQGVFSGSAGVCDARGAQGLGERLA